MTRIVVIGGGIAGLSVAANLAREAEVTVLEAEEALGYHSSGRSAALIEENYGAPPVQALNRASFPLLSDGGYLSPRGLLLLGKTDEKAAFDRDAEVLGTHPLSVAEACDMVPILNPDAIGFAGFHKEAYDIDTDLLLQDFARAVRAAGGKIINKARVTAITRQAHTWLVSTKDQSHEADKIVNAGGAWADTIAQMAGVAPLSIVPHRRSVARVPAPEDHDVSKWPIFFGIGESWYAKPDAGALLISPADEDPVEPHDAWAEDLTLATGIARYQEVVTPEVTRVLSSWAGLRSFAPDRSLVLGPDPDAPDFIWCAAQGGYGMQTSFAAAQLTADLTLGRASALPGDIIAALKPDRLH